jgi:hypothetical protein
VDVVSDHIDASGIPKRMEIMWSFAVAVAIIIGLVEVIKRMGLNSKYAPFVSVVLGVAFSFLFPQANIGLTIVFGIIVGLTSCGLYSGTKATVSA